MRGKNLEFACKLIKYTEFVLVCTYKMTMMTSMASDGGIWLDDFSLISSYTS